MTYTRALHHFDREYNIATILIKDEGGEFFNTLTMPWVMKVIRDLIDLPCHTMGFKMLRVTTKKTSLSGGFCRTSIKKFSILRL